MATVVINRLNQSVRTLVWEEGKNTFVEQAISPRGRIEVDSEKMSPLIGEQVKNGILKLKEQPAEPPAE